MAYRFQLIHKVSDRSTSSRPGIWPVWGKPFLGHVLARFARTVQHRVTEFYGTCNLATGLEELIAQTLALRLVVLPRISIF